MSRFAPGSLDACRAALIASFARSNPGIALDGKGYVSSAEQNLIEGVLLADFEADLRQGDGNELEGKFRAAHSSSALAVNTFAPFKQRPATLQLPVGGGFTALSFERKCPHGLAGRRPPNLDAVLEGADARRETQWFCEMQRLVGNLASYSWLDAAQLIKHALGVMHSFGGQPATLLYLYWEPANPGANPMFAEHRAEISRFASSIGGGGLEFAAMSYPELWTWWENHGASLDLQTHVRHLKARYSVAA
jgi:hypothetical protein